jgi:hypothetical protein
MFPVQSQSLLYEVEELENTFPHKDKDTMTNGLAYDYCYDKWDEFYLFVQQSCTDNIS